MAWYWQGSTSLFQVRSDTMRLIVRYAKCRVPCSTLKVLAHTFHSQSGHIAAVWASINGAAVDETLLTSAVIHNLLTSLISYLQYRNEVLRQFWCPEIQDKRI